MYYRYIPSECNVADGPSRGVGPGAAEETKRAHADRWHGGLLEALRSSQQSVEEVDVVSAKEAARLMAAARGCAGFAGG